MEKVGVKVKFLHENAKLPYYGSPESAGFDLYSVEDVELAPKSINVLSTGISLEIQEGYCWQFWDRSGLAAKGITHFGGLVDSDYRGEFKVILYNASEETYNVEKGDRIIQVVPVPIIRADFSIVDSLSESVRGEGGFHSTGKK